MQPQARAIQEPQGIVVFEALVDLLNELRKASSLVEVNIAAGIAHETLTRVG